MSEQQSPGVRLRGRYRATTPEADCDHACLLQGSSEIPMLMNYK